MATPQLTPQDRRKAALNAVAKFTRMQVEGDEGQGIGRMRTLRPGEQTRLVRRDPTLRKAFRRLRVSSASAAGTSMKIRGIVKNLRTRIRKEGGVEFRTRAGGKKYLLVETNKSRRGKVGIKGLSREAVKEVVVEAEEKREEQVETTKKARIVHRRRLDDADERRRKRMAEIRMTREGRENRTAEAIQSIRAAEGGQTSIADQEKLNGTTTARQESPEMSVAGTVRSTTSVTPAEQSELQASIADVEHEVPETAPEEPAGDAFTPVEDTSIDMPGVDGEDAGGTSETEG